MLSLAAYLPILAYLAFQFSGIPSVLEIWRQKSTGSKSPLTFVMLYVNGYIWTAYGVFAADWTVLISNATSIVLGLLYSGLFYSQIKDAPKRKNMERLVVVSFVFISLLSLLLYINSADTERPDETEAAGIKISGVVGSISAVCLMGSPLAVMKLVIEKQNSIFLPIPITLCANLNAFTWTIYGLTRKDLFIIVPNTVGLVLGMVQICLLFAFQRVEVSPDRGSATELVSFI